MTEYIRQSTYLMKVPKVGDVDLTEMSNHEESMTEDLHHSDIEIQLNVAPEREHNSAKKMLSPKQMIEQANFEDRLFKILSNSGSSNDPNGTLNFSNSVKNELY